MIYGNAFQSSPSSKIFAWNDISLPAAQGKCSLTGPAMNPNKEVPSLSCTTTGGTGFLGFSNRGIGNEGFAFEGEKDYEGYLVVLAPAATTITVAINDRVAFMTLASASVAVPASAQWQVVNFTLTPSAGTQCSGIAPGSDASIDCGNMGPNPGHICVRCGGEFAVGFSATPGVSQAVSIGYVSLMPGTWGRLAGLPVLKSTLDAMAEMGISVIRQGGTVSQSFTWKEWRGVPWNRTSMGKQWGDSLIGSWGMFEFLDMCNAANIKPVVTLAYDTNSAEDWADLIEYMYGDQTTSWGAVRHADGHPLPYFLDTMELGNEQENPDFVQQVTAIEARRAQIGAPELFYMYPTNQGVSQAVADQLTAIPLAARHVMPDCHVGGGGGVQCAQGDFERLPGFEQSFINCETNAAISTMQRAIQEAADLQDWFNVSASLQERLRARTASFCTERSGHYDAFDQGIAFFLPNMTWLQPPGHVHAMITKTWVEGGNALLIEKSAPWLSATAQISDDASQLVVQLVNSQDSTGPSTVSLSIPGFSPDALVSVWTLQVPDTAAGAQPNKDAGNTPATPDYISPAQSTMSWPLGASVLNVTLPAYSFTILKVYAK